MKKPSVAAEGLSMRVLLEPETVPIGSITLQSTWFHSYQWEQQLCLREG